MNAETVLSFHCILWLRAGSLCPVTGCPACGQALLELTHLLNSVALTVNVSGGTTDLECNCANSAGPTCCSARPLLPVSGLERVNSSGQPSSIYIDDNIFSNLDLIWRTNLDMIVLCLITIYLLPSSNSKRYSCMLHSVLRGESLVTNDAFLLTLE